MVVVLTEDLLLSLVSFPEFKLIQKIEEHVENFAVHPFQDEVYVAKKNLQLLLYRRDEANLKLSLQKGQEMALLHYPIQLEWGGSHGEFLYVAD